MDMALQFRNLLMVIEKGSLGKAAEALRISQPAMTKSIRRLEEQLGVPLFDRGARGMRPTLYGNVLRAHAQGITIGIEQALRDIAALRAGSEGTVRVAAGPIMTNEILVKAVLRLMRDRPKLRINIHTAIGNTDEDLVEGKHDLVLALLPPGDPPSWLAQEPIFDDRVALIARRGHPLVRRKRVDLRDLSKASWVLPAAGHYHRRRLESVFEAERLPYPVPTIECGSTDFIKKIVAESEHLGVIAAMGLVREESATLSEVPLNSPLMIRSIGVMWRKNAFLSQPCLLLIRALREVCSEMKAASLE
jgi:DNA-binding transcriptional LysR family regulator